ncbi:hypothetical protein [Metabacillus rhizolycopersici]|uniref:Uncharacterized protein n=1 Tax=Metabacillus rhizolycopersici TaxID=2875709 RepID=A0ABS7UZF2_9BACI|nr:hypothetical protein [Metabacillus rhizolycopersici]MBZ5753710.1 hypothetical protein [Metabacillus rhizolycopersici]
MARKIFDIHKDLLVLFGIWFAIRFIYTKEIYIQVNGYTVNTLSLLILTIVLVALDRVRHTETSEEKKIN